MESRAATPLLTMIFVMIIGLFMAIFLGYAVAGGSFMWVAVVLSLGPIFILVLGLQHRIWLIIPFLSSFYGKLVFLPVPFTVGEVAIMATFGTFVLLAIFKKLPGQGRFDFLDFLLLINLLYLASVYIRNPVGVRIFATEQVGGRPYVIVLISCMLYWVYSHISLKPKLAYYLPLIGLAGSACTFLLWLATYLSPKLAAIIARFYTGVEMGTLLAQYSGIESDSNILRLSGLGEFGLASMMCLIAYFRPLTLLSPMHFARFCAFFAAGASILMGGFRSKLATMILYFFTASFYRGGAMDLFRTAILAIVAFFVLIGSHFIGLYQLPLTAQRALSFLPMEWDNEAIESAERSSQWRFQMWQDVWESDTWIKNKLLGDGFGFTRADMAIMFNQKMGGQGFIGVDSTTGYKISGTFHSGILSAIRFVGIFGFLLYLAMIIGIAFKAHRLIRETADTSFQPLAYMMIPALFAPFVYIFIFGAYDVDLPETIARLAVLKLISRSFDDYRASLSSAVPNTADSEEAASANAEPAFLASK